MLKIFINPQPNSSLYIITVLKFKRECTNGLKLLQDY